MRTIRFYEDSGLLRGVKRKVGGVRYFTEDDVRWLKFIQRLKRLGLPLREIKDLADMWVKPTRNTRAVRTRLDRLLTEHLSSIDKQMHELRSLQSEISTYRTYNRERLRRGED